MTREEAIAILENEKKCVNRANKNDYCNRDCYNCELVKTDTEILNALDMAIKELEQEPCTDAISRQAAIKAAMQDVSDRRTQGFKCGATRAATRIKLLPSVNSQPKTGWIPVTERLPEVGQYVLCYLKGWHYLGKYRVCKYRDADKYVNHPYFDFNENGFPDVLAWMPLPALYEGSEKDG